MMTLGNMINLLKIFDPEEYIRFDFGDFVPLAFNSFRGDYSQLALSYKEYEDILVRDLKEHCYQTNGKYFEGYKGGNYLMTLDTPIWIANWGNSTQTIPETIIKTSIGCIITTRYEEY